ncbi:LamG domain-containing protein [Micromonospora sp. NPDC047707]|uniref:LamG domain-containing protein n=1 Tax=Micromonospora sp. NPDC047707 TaxID=3154498 RepID=UPI0034542E35
MWSRVLCLVVVGVLVGAGGVGPSVAGVAGHNLTHYKPDVGTLDEPWLAAAAREARRSGRLVEVSRLRTETQEVHAKPSGSFVATVRSKPVRAKRADGSWGEIDTRLRRGSDGGVAPTNVPMRLRFSGGGAGPLVTAERDGKAFAWSWPRSLPKPVLKGDTATYRDVLAGVDLTVKATADGFVPKLVVRSRAAAENPVLRRIQLPMQARGLSFRAAGGGVTALDEGGVPVVAVTAAQTQSADGTLRPVSLDVNQDAVILMPEAAVLTGTSTVFPLAVGTSVTVWQSNWSMINKTHPDQSYWAYDRNDYAKVGYVSENGIHTYRSMWVFGTSAFRGKHILNAFFKGDLKHSYQCTDTPTDLHLVPPFRPETTWSNHAHLWTDYLGSSSSNACGFSGPKYVEWVSAALTDRVRQAAAGWPDITLGLRAPNEGVINDQWKKFVPESFALSVEYNTYPDALTAMTVEHKPCLRGPRRPWLGTVTPTLRARVADQDGDVLSGFFGFQEMFPGGGLGGEVTYRQDGLASGSVAQWRAVSPHLSHGRSYQWYGSTIDEHGAWSSASPICEFSLDVVPPDKAPTVASADGVYPEGGIGGGPGVSGWFTFGSNGVSDNGVNDVVGYQFGLSGAGKTVYATGLGRSASVRVTPPAVGAYTLTVRSIDRANNPSTVSAQYRFTVASQQPAGGTVARWSMDDKSGNELVDTSGGHSATLSGAPTLGIPGRTLLEDDTAVRFDGVGQSAATAGPVVDTRRSFSVSAWVRLPARPSQNVTAIAQSGERASLFLLQYRKDKDRWAFRVFGSDSDNPVEASVLSGAAPQVGDVWTHLVGTYDTATQELKLYVNGNLEGTARSPIARYSPGPLTIGKAKFRGGDVDFWPGDIDDVRVWQRVISPNNQNEIDRMVNGLALRSQWDFAERTDAVTRDLTGRGNDIRLYQGAGWGSGRPERPENPMDDGSLRLDGVDDFAGSLAGGAVRTDQSFSVAAWVRLNSKSASVTAVSQAATAGGQAAAFELRYDRVADQWAFAVSGSDSSSPVWFTARSKGSTAPGDVIRPTVGVWTHVVGVYNAGDQTVTLYVNGVPQETAARGSGVWNATGALTLGRTLSRGVPAGYWPGEIDDVRVFQGVAYADDALFYYHQP